MVETTLIPKKLRCFSAAIQPPVARGGRVGGDLRIQPLCEGRTSLLRPNSDATPGLPQQLYVHIDAHRCLVSLLPWGLRDGAVIED